MEAQSQVLCVTIPDSPEFSVALPHVVLRPQVGDSGFRFIGQHSIVKSLNAEGMGNRRLKIEVDQCYKHEKTPGEGVYKKLECDPDPVITAPNRCYEIGRY